jgi:hypothetical protein
MLQVAATWSRNFRRRATVKPLRFGFVCSDPRAARF